MTLFVQLFLACKKIVAQCNHPHIWRKKSKNEKQLCPFPELLVSEERNILFLKNDEKMGQKLAIQSLFHVSL